MELQGAEKYQAESLPKIEACVQEQISTNTYSLDSNLALLRFYHINPSCLKADLVAKALLKAIMQLPNADFRACVHLLSDRLQSEETVAKVLALAAALESSRFTDFWAAAAKCKDLLDSVPGFYDAVRANIIQLLGISFQRLLKTVLGSYLNMQPAEVDALVKSKGWSTASSPSGELVVLPKNELNQVVVKRTQEVIRLEQVAPVLRSTTVGFY